MILEVTNNRTAVLGATEQELWHIDNETRFPTVVAEAMEKGFVPPAWEEGGWDGWIRLLRRPKRSPPWFPTGLLLHVLRICAKMGFPAELCDLRQRPQEGVPEFTKKLIVDRDYQLAAAEAAVREGRGILDMPPRSGKTRTMCEIQRRLGLPTLWLAPTDRIVRQTREVLEGFFGSHYVTHLVGSKLEAEAAKFRVVVCTASTAAGLSEEFYRTREVIVVDEFHHAAAKTYHNDIFRKCEHVYFRFGMTGTFFRSGQDELALHALISNVIYRIEPKELLDRGYLVPTEVAFLPVAAPKLRGLPEKTFQSGHGKFGIHEHKDRNVLVSWAAASLYQTGRKVLVLVGTKRQGYQIRDLLSSFVKPAPSGCQFRSVEFVSTDTDRKIQTGILESFLNGQEVKILLGTSLLGEGVDLPSADALVYARGERAEVSLTQNAYRVCTATPGKTKAVIVDFADRHHRKLLEHSSERLAVYYGEPTFAVSVLRTAEEFLPWLTSLDTLPARQMASA